MWAITKAKIKQVANFSVYLNLPRLPCLFVDNICQFQWYHSPNLMRSERYITGSELSNKMCAFQIKFNAYCLKRAVGHETKCCWPRNKLHRFQRFPIKILCSQSSSAWREDNVKFDQQPLQKSASCWREGSLGFHCLLPNAQRKVHVTWTFLCWGCKFVWFFKHIPSESETFLAMILFANWSSDWTLVIQRASCLGKCKWEPAAASLRDLPASSSSPAVGGGTSE